ncbi:unnamed protein product [Phyllotreta striolata]|uniref:Centromere protein C n=1 Tax=Phyllotreta striolata TaxID=444603 RepID=A0A9N9XX37_PHYSR|nr:unnamed protein product [Phyllotreta striolata]
MFRPHSDYGRKRLIQRLKRHRHGLFNTPEIKYPRRSFLEKVLHPKNKCNVISSTPLPNRKRPLAVSSAEFSPIANGSYNNGVTNSPSHTETFKKPEASIRSCSNKANNRSKLLKQVSIASTSTEDESGSIRKNAACASNNNVNLGELEEDSSDSDGNNEDIFENRPRSNHSRNSNKEVSLNGINNFLKRNISKSIKSCTSTKSRTPSRLSLHDCINRLHEQKNMEVQTSLSRYNDQPASIDKNANIFERNLFNSLQDGPLIDSMGSYADYNVLRKPSTDAGWRMPSRSGLNNTTGLCYNVTDWSNNNKRYQRGVKNNLKTYRRLGGNANLGDFRRSIGFGQNSNRETDSSSIDDDDDFIPKSTSKNRTNDVPTHIHTNNNGRDHEMESSSSDGDVNDSSNMLSKSTTNIRKWISNNSKRTNNESEMENCTINRISLRERTNLVNNADQEKENFNIDENNEYLNVNGVRKSTSKLNNGRKSAHKKVKHTNNESEIDNYNNIRMSLHEKTSVINDPDQDMENLGNDEEDDEYLKVKGVTKSTSKLSNGRKSVHKRGKHTNNDSNHEMVDQVDDSRVNTDPKSTSKLSNGRKSGHKKDNKHTNNASVMENYNNNRTSLHVETNVINNTEQEMENLSTGEDGDEYSNVNGVTKSPSKLLNGRKSVHKSAKRTNNDSDHEMVDQVDDNRVNTDPKSISKLSNSRKSVHEKDKRTNNESDHEIVNQVDDNRVNTDPKSTSKLSNSRKSVHEKDKSTNNGSEMENSNITRRSLRVHIKAINDLRKETENLNPHEDNNDHTVSKPTSKRRNGENSVRNKSNVPNDKESDSLDCERAHRSKQIVSISEQTTSSMLETIREHNEEQSEIAGPSRRTIKKIKRTGLRKTFDGIDLAPQEVTNNGRPVRNRRPPPAKVYDNLFNFVYKGGKFCQKSAYQEDETVLFKKPAVKRVTQAKPKKSVTKTNKNKSVTKTNKNKSKAQKISDETTEDAGNEVQNERVSEDPGPSVTENNVYMDVTERDAGSSGLSNSTDRSRYNLKPGEMISSSAVEENWSLIVRRGHGTLIVNGTNVKIKQFDSFELPRGKY